MSYVDGFVLPVPRNKVNAYRKMAQIGYKTWMKHGALDYKECVGEDLNTKWGVSFRKLARAKSGDTVILATIVFKSRAHRDAVNKKVMKEMEKAGEMPEMPFDMRKMAYGGFKTIVGK